MRKLILLLMFFGQGPQGHLTTFDATDAPAIQESREQEYGSSDWCNSCSSDGACTAMFCDPHAKHTVTVWTCFDKDRILLTSENGKRHCVKF